MTAPQRTSETAASPSATSQRTTPNPGTVDRPERSSRRVGRKTPLAWLPWAVLAAIAALLLLVLLLVNAVDDDGPEGAAGDSLGQVSSEDGESPIGTDGGQDGTGGQDGAAGGQDGGAGGDALARVSEQALVGGGSVQPGRAQETAGAEALAGEAGTAGTVLFAEASAEIDAAGQEVVTAAAASLREAGVTAVEVVGHTDRIAGDPVNDTLSQDRAEAVAAALRAELPGVQVSTAARGQDEPVAGNDSEQGRQLNRRAVITAVS